MIKKHISSYKGMSKDLARDLQSDKYFDAKNIRIMATDQKSSFAVTNEAGNELVFQIPTPIFDFNNTRITYDVNGVTKELKYTTNSSVIPRCRLEEDYVDTSAIPVAKTSLDQIIIGVKELRDSAIFITTDNFGFDCFWELTGLDNGNYDLNLLYMGNLGLSTSNLVQIIYNYENSVIQKIYFVDGKHQLRYFNIKQSVENGDLVNLIDLNPDAIDTVSTFTLSQPEPDQVISGGSHTSGMIQYAYGLYILNGAQTTISPVSELIPIDKGPNLGGGEVNEVLGRSVVVNIPSIDTQFTNIKIYSIKYTAFNEIPEIKIIADREIDNFDNFSVIDDGTSTETISLEAFTFLGSAPIIPQHIITKDNRLFPINVKQQRFIVDLDMRAYSYSSGGSAVVMENVSVDDASNIQGTTRTVPGDFNIPPKHDSINADYETYKFQSNGTTVGAEGKYVKLEIFQASLSDSEARNYQFLKDRELYRFGLKFYNRRGQTSDPKWIADLKTPSGNLEGDYNQLRVTLTADFYVWLNDSSNFESDDDKPIGYKILRADRTLLDQTIYAQGFINPTIANYKSRSKNVSYAERVRRVNSNESDILPSMVRMFESQKPMVKCKDYHCLSWIYEDSNCFSCWEGGVPGIGRYLGLSRQRSTEGFKSSDSQDFVAQNYQHSRLMQFFSPEVLFRNAQIDASYKLRVVGLAEQDDIANWSAEVNPVNANKDQETIFKGGLTTSTLGVTYQIISGSPSSLSDQGFFGPTNSEGRRAEHQVYRSFNGTYYPAPNVDEYEIYGTPEITEHAADFKRYNNDGALRYANSLKTMIMDNWNYSADVHKDANVQILGCNTNGARCITFAQGPDDPTFPLESRMTIERMHELSNISETKGVLIAEFVKDNSVLYTSNIYGGMSFEAKANATYIEIGKFQTINNSTILIESPGDTFVDVFTFTKLVKDDLEINSENYNLLSEIVSVRVETTVDLKNRNDLSLDEWNNRYQPRYEEYTKYNTVYSQQPTLVKSVGLGSKIKKVQEFDTRIMASKEKIPGEFVDSWTDFLENETLDLDGQYGPINAVVNMRDQVFCLQDTAVAQISINPRVQINPEDGIGLELGTGGILQEYSYKSTVAGCLNRWGVVKSENAFYFIDAINKGIISFDGNVGRLSDAKGFHHELLNRMKLEDLRFDNPVLGKGVQVGYNPVNSDVYFSFLQSTDSFTLGFNEVLGEFISYYDYVPAWYVNKGSVMMTTNPNNKQIWEHFKGVPNNFYGTNYKSAITLHVAPQGDEIILNGATYKLELTNQNGVEVPNKGLTGVRVYNEYQDSGEVELILRTNVWKKFRNWKLNFPRQSGSRDRVRSAWGFAEFSFDNADGNKLILHDITIFYTQH